MYTCLKTFPDLICLFVFELSTLDDRTEPESNRISCVLSVWTVYSSIYRVKLICLLLCLTDPTMLLATLGFYVFLGADCHNFYRNLTEPESRDR